jgi:hypothetical protein
VVKKRVGSVPHDLAIAKIKPHEGKEADKVEYLFL